MNHATKLLIESDDTVVYICFQCCFNNMSLTAFCRYFKTSTKKSYVEFLNEIRIGYACKLLQDTDKTIIYICYESGFNTAVSFNKQFYKVKRLTPGKFRKKFLTEVH